MKKILLLESEPNINKTYLSYFEEKGYKLLELSDSFENNEIEGLIFRSGVNIDKNILGKYKNIKFIFRIGVGLDNIDMKLCKEKGILVLSSTGANADSVADLAIWGTLSLLRKIKDLGNNNLNDLGNKNRFNYMGEGLSTKTVAIIGFGNIGKKIYKRLVGFGVEKIAIIDPFVGKIEIEGNFDCKKYKNIDEVGEKIDILYMNLPLNDKTKGYLNKSILDGLKFDVKIINVARGELIVVDDLYNFLSINKNAGVYIDMGYNGDFEKIGELKNCIITPHIGAMTKEANIRMHKINIDILLDL